LPHPLNHSSPAANTLYAFIDAFFFERKNQMADNYPPLRQRPKLEELREALDARRNALQRDECGDWAIFGKFGHIYAVPLDRAAIREGFQIVFGLEHCVGLSARGAANSWGAARRKLEPFCRLAQDGDDGGTLFLERLPTPEEAETLRSVLGIYRRYRASAPSAAQLAQRAAFAEAVQRRASA